MRLFLLVACLPVVANAYALQLSSSSSSAFTMGRPLRSMRALAVASSESFPSIGLPSSPSLLQRFPAFLHTLWQFSRPHTILGSGISILSIFAFATPASMWSKAVFWRQLGEAMLPSLFMNVYVTGLNQVTDVDIDRVNKPYLPLASGDLSQVEGIAVIITSLFLSFLFSRSMAWPIQATLLSSAILGTSYSLPPLRLKRFPLFAALCILVVRGSIVNIGYSIVTSLCKEISLHVL